ncbi:MAG: Hsp20/alpha crystallin family protein [Proteobacteria bacterium]|nr:Hsp20/alpha crystallin family protein [Pseudomonadota bacterium]
MNTPEQLGHHGARSDESAEEGWYALRQRASHALTHFSPQGLPERQEDQWHYAAHWAMVPAELWETPESVEVDLEAPGMMPEGFEIEVADDVLVIRGTKSPAENPDEPRYFIRERAYGIFERAFHLPAAVEHQEARARYRDGILRVSLPKSRRGRENRITVESV